MEETIPVDQVCNRFIKFCQDKKIPADIFKEKEEAEQKVVRLEKMMEELQKSKEGKETMESWKDLL